MDLFWIFRNYFWSVGHILSVRLLLRTLFVPWKRIEEGGISFFASPGDFVANLFINLVMRLLGLVIRLCLLVVAMISASALVVLFLLLLCAWILLPLILARILIVGINFLFA